MFLSVSHFSLPFFGIEPVGCDPFLRKKRDLFFARLQLRWDPVQAFVSHCARDQKALSTVGAHALSRLDHQCRRGWGEGNFLCFEAMSWRTSVGPTWIGLPKMGTCCSRSFMAELDCWNTALNAVSRWRMTLTILRHFEISLPRWNKNSLQCQLVVSSRLGKSIPGKDSSN